MAWRKGPWNGRLGDGQTWLGTSARLGLGTPARLGLGTPARLGLGTSARLGLGRRLGRTLRRVGPLLVIGAAHRERRARCLG